MLSPPTSGTSVSTQAWAPDSSAPLRPRLPQQAPFRTPTPVVHGDARRVLVQRFPFCLFYRLNSDGVILIACLHAARDPEPSLSRVPDDDR